MTDIQVYMYPLEALRNYSACMYNVHVLILRHYTKATSIGYLMFSNPLCSAALGPMNTSPSRPPAMTRTCLGRPMLGGREGWREEARRYAEIEACVKEVEGVCDGGGKAVIDAVEEEQLKGTSQPQYTVQTTSNSLIWPV